MTFVSQHPRAHRARVAALLAVTAAMFSTAISCAPAGSSAAAPSSIDAPILVEVGNRNWADVVVYAVRSGMRWRLGTVASMSEMTFRVPESAGLTTGSMRLMVDPIGSSHGFATEPISVLPGQRVRFNVEAQLPLSHITIR